MALETCFRAWALHAAPAGGKDRLVVGSSSSSFAPSKRAAAAPLSVGRVATRRPRHVCQSKNAVDEGTCSDRCLGFY
jgi:thioredoxin 1